MNGQGFVGAERVRSGFIKLAFFAIRGRGILTRNFQIGCLGNILCHCIKFNSRMCVKSFEEPEHIIRGCEAFFAERYDEFGCLWHSGTDWKVDQMMKFG